MEKYSFFNSVSGDRKYKAEDIAGYFSKFITNGVFPNVASNLQVIADTNNMQTKVKAGAAWINGYMYYNDSDLILTHDTADGVLNRIDRIVVRLDFQQRLIQSVIKKGIFASSPVAPTLQRNADMYELAIADVYIGNGVISITQANVTDLRLNTSLCGMVNSLITVDTTIVTDQMQTDFNNWFNTIKGQLGTDVAGNLQNQIIQLNTNVGDKSTLTTIDKSSTVNAINEVKGEVVAHKADNTKQIPHLGTTTNVGDAYSITTTETILANQKFTIKFNAASVTAPTLKINSGTVYAIKKANGNNAKLYASVYTLFWDGSNFIQLGEGGEYGTAIASDVLSAKTIGTDTGLVTGTMPNRGTFNLGLGVSVPAGYYSGGTTADGKQWASGTLSNVSYSSPPVINLGFIPKRIIISCDMADGNSHPTSVNCPSLNGTGWITAMANDSYNRGVYVASEPTGNSFSLTFKSTWNATTLNWMAIA